MLVSVHECLVMCVRVCVCACRRQWHGRLILCDHPDPVIHRPAVDVFAVAPSPAVRTVAARRVGFLRDREDVRGGAEETGARKQAGGQDQPSNAKYNQLLRGG